MPVRLISNGLLFEVGVDKGSLIVSGLNHRGAVGQPENEWLVARLLDHAAGFPQPKVQWPASLVAVGSRRTISVDQFGLFHLMVPCDMLKPGEPCVLGVRSLETGSRRWFGLNPCF
jgi:hypothetical protein